MTTIYLFFKPRDYESRGKVASLIFKETARNAPAIFQYPEDGVLIAKVSLTAREAEALIKKINKEVTIQSYNIITKGGKDDKSGNA